VRALISSYSFIPPSLELLKTPAFDEVVQSPKFVPSREFLDHFGISSKNSRGVFHVNDPSTRQVMGTLPIMTAKDCEELVEKAFEKHKTFRVWKIIKMIK